MSSLDDAESSNGRSSSCSSTSSPLQETIFEFSQRIFTLSIFKEHSNVGCTWSPLIVPVPSGLFPLGSPLAFPILQLLLIE